MSDTKKEIELDKSLDLPEGFDPDTLGDDSEPIR